MRCPKCGYNSFESLDNCKKCKQDLREFKSRYNLKSLLFPAVAATVAAPAARTAASSARRPAPVDSGADDFDFGLDDLDEPPSRAARPKTASEPAEVEEADLAGDLWGELPEAQLETQPLDELAQAAEGAGDETDPLGLEDAPAEQEFALTGNTFEATWESEELPNLEIELPAPELEPLDFGEDELAESQEPQPVSEDLDEGLEEIDFGDFGVPGETPPAAPQRGGGKTGGEEPRDPFEQPEPALAEQTPETLDEAREAYSRRQPTLPLAAAAAAAAETSPEEFPAVASPEDLLVFDGPAGDTRANAEEQLLPTPLARIGACCLDLFLIGGAFLLFLIIGTRLLAAPGSRELLPSAQVLLQLSIPYYLLLVLVSFLYFTGFHFVLGQTPGKMLFGVRLELQEGGPLGLSEAFLHSVGGLASLLSLGVGFFTAFFDTQGRGWADRLAGTRLVALPAEDAGGG